MSSSTRPVEWLTDEEQHTWVMLVGVLMNLPPAIDAQLKRDTGLNFFEYSILVSLSRPMNHTVQMSLLAQSAGGSLSRLSHAVSRMEKQGWVRRKVNDSEVRCVEAVLTDAGMEMLRTAAPGHVTEIRRLIFDALTPEQVGQLLEISRAVLTRANPESADTMERIIAEQL
ncbi:MarR family transcriptional regulator [Actinoplanes sp. NBRC 103695]|uniref:MarR family winged helix-turn-helix transcriptional regulator n=1 Tax=Actinoplanes sp. NBRC 103695 TaxID=3032202 RepID=UPI0024A2B0E9|nr:MarR family transcriptional regulator [Actinoplanes sp. NBRC 103695]GLY95144.1 MarR family transcriptional regulator [Actinoplanes sp. NBRC 103695]